LRIGAALISASLVLGCASDQSKVQERIAFWKETLAREVPLGTPADQIQEWGSAHKIKFDYLEKQRWLYAIAEMIPETGIRFPCSQWNIILKISIDGGGRSVKNDVSAVGSCV
jgi:hypothetical protein